MNRHFFIAVVILSLVSFSLSGQEDVRSRDGLFIPIICNALLPGFGVGSFIQGDTTNGIIQLATELLGLGVLVISVISAEGGEEDLETVMWGIGIGGGLSFAARLWGALCPIRYADVQAARLHTYDGVRLKRSFGPVVLNLFPGFGLGSFIQGDPWGGAIELLVEGIGYGALMMWATGSGGTTASAYQDPVYIIGSCLMYGARFTWGIIRPLWFARKYNARLLESTVSLDVVPSLSSTRDRKYSLELHLTIRYPT